MNTTPKPSFSRIAQDWVQIFAAGNQTDSKGNAKEWTNADLEEMARNFDANDSFPIVVGHPKDNTPAFGWGQALKVEAGKLFAKFEKVAPQFIKWGEDGHIRNRSVKILKGPTGFKIAHVGFLGASPPAVEGMDAVQFSADEGQVFEFAAPKGWALSLQARFQRRVRDFLIEKFGQEAADRVVPSYEIESAEQLAAEAVAEEHNSISRFNAPENPENTPVKTFTQADLDAATAQARTETEAKLAPQLKAAQDAERTAQFNARVSANKEFVDSLVKNAAGECRLLPANAAGVAEFLSALEGIDAAASEFTFTAADKVDKKIGFAQFAKDMLGGLPVALKLGKEHADTDTRVDLKDAAALEKAASEFQAAEAKAGRSISISQAVTQIVANGGAQAS